MPIIEEKVEPAGIKKENFYWFLKECEWSFTGGDHKKLLNQLKIWVEEEPKSTLTSIVPKYIITGYSYGKLYVTISCLVVK